MTTAPDTNVTRLSYAFARSEGVMILLEGERPVLVRREGAELPTLLEARRVLGAPASIRSVSSSDYETLMAQVYASADLSSSAEAALEGPESLSALADELPRTSDLLDSDDDAPVIRLINGIFQEAIHTRASDIHLEPYEERLCVRFRVDGILREMLSLSSRLSPVLVSRVKVMAQLDIAKKRVPQDGRFSLSLGKRSVDVRVSSLPSQYGERVVMRILEKDSARLSLAELGMDPQVLKNFEEALARPNGIVLVTGPTGSGKTTTLYACVLGLNDGTRSILTIEDPVEYSLDGVGQTQVNTRMDMSFAAGLRAILRQDPDVVMVGEIRDPETTEIAVQASLTGHLVLSTLHTNSAIAAIARLRDMGVEPFLLASTVSAILAQRLVRRLCPACKVAYQPSAQELTDLDLAETDSHQFYHPGGCEACHQIGYSGRIGLYEIVTLDDHLRAMIHKNASDAEMADYAFRDQRTLLQNGAEKIMAGLTSTEEVLRVCQSRQKGHHDGSL